MKRYDMQCDFGYNLFEVESLSGAWVKAEDVEALEAELERCAAELEKLRNKAHVAIEGYESTRLSGELEGVRLALSKLRGQ